MYIVISSFKDSTDNNFEYQVGDQFPRANRSIDEITAERLEELMTSKNKKGRALIRKIEVAESEDEAAEADDAEETETEGEAAEVDDAEETKPKVKAKNKTQGKKNQK